MLMIKIFILFWYYTTWIKLLTNFSLQPDILIFMKPYKTNFPTKINSLYYHKVIYNVLYIAHTLNFINVNEFLVINHKIIIELRSKLFFWFLLFIVVFIFKLLIQYCPIISNGPPNVLSDLSCFFLYYKYCNFWRRGQCLWKLLTSHNLYIV